MRTPSTHWYVAGIVVMAMLLDGKIASASEKLLGRISKFECGDNCYISIAVEKNTEKVFLCHTNECSSWMEKGGIPEKLKGSPVEVYFRSGGRQIDGNGDFVSFFDEVVDLKFVSNKERFEQEISNAKADVERSRADNFIEIYNRMKPGDDINEIRSREIIQKIVQISVAVSLFVLCASFIKYRRFLYHIIDNMIVLLLYMIEKTRIEIGAFAKRIRVRVNEKLAAGKPED